MECALENTTVHYEQFGEGKPLLLLHGWPVDHRHKVKDFEPLFELRDGWKRIYPDMPGMGKTPGPGWITNQDQMLDVLMEFINAVIPEQNYCVAGTSYGGYLAQGLIYRRPQMIDGALFLSPLMGVNLEDRSLPEHVTLVEDKALLANLEADEVAIFQEFAVVQSQELLDSLRVDVIPAIEMADHAFLEKVSEQYFFSFDVNTLPRPFEKPVLFLLGRQDSAVGYIDAWNVIENYPRASYVVLDRAGHGLGVEQKGLLRALAGEWLDRVEESSAQAQRSA
jgi:pimeloyl-ACP methyl ester carboxylesterase